MVFEIPASDQNAFQIPEEDKQQTPSALGAIGRGAVDALPLGAKGLAEAQYIATGKPYEQNLANFDKDVATDKEEMPIAHYTGEVAGSVAPLAIPGVGEALSSETALGRAGIGAGLGALQGVSQTRNDITTPEGASDVAKSALMGGVAAPVLGAIGDTLGKFFRGAVKVANGVGAETSEHVIPPEAATGAEDIFKGAPATPASVESPTAPASTTPPSMPSGKPPSVADVPLGVQAKQGFFPSKEELKAEVLAGALGGTPRQFRALPGKDLVASLNHMGDVIAENSTPDNPLIAAGDRYADRLQKFIALAQKSGKTIGDTIEQSGLGPMNTDPIKEAIQKAVQFPNLDDTIQLKNVMKQLDAYSAMENTPGSISFGRLQQFKTALGDQAFPNGSPALKNVYHAISDIQNQALEKAGDAIDLPAFQKAKEAFQVTQQAIPMLRMSTARSLAKGYSSYGAPLASLVTGHPIDALGHMLKEPLQRAANAVAFGASRGSGAVGAASEAPVMATVTNGLLNHPAMTPYRQSFQNAMQGAKDAAESEKAASVVDYTLSQRDPAYAAAKAKAQEELGK